MDFYYLDQPITLPQPEFEIFAYRILKRLRTLRKLYTHRLFVPSSTVYFIHLVWVNLAPEQQAGIKAVDELGDIEWFVEQMGHYPAVVEQAKDPRQRHAFSSPEWAHYIRDVPRDRVVRIEGPELVEIFTEYGKAHPELNKGKVDSCD
jgi:hypothetical protein